MTQTAGGADSTGERLEFVQALRGVAALAVVLFHVRFWIYDAELRPVLDRAFERGAAGVDLFFVISGLIMVHTTWRAKGGPHEAARFFARRFARIWPVYVIATFAVILANHGLHRWATPRGALHLGKAFVFYPTTPT